MSNIGPQLPPHLQKQFEVGDEEEEDIGPALPPSIGPGLTNLKDKDAKRREAGPSRPPQQRRLPSLSPPAPTKRVLGPSLPTYGPTYNPSTYSQVLLQQKQRQRQADEDDSDDDDVGPQPLPAGMKHVESDAVREFMEKEERRRKQLEESNKPKAPKRDEWMLVPPSNSDLLGNLDPSKLKKGRQFSKSTTNPSSSSSSSHTTSLWTETPEERQKRLEDELIGRKKRALDPTPVDEDGNDIGSRKRSRQEEEWIRKGVEDYTKKNRGAALVDQHAATTAAQKDSDEPPVIWDHARDMAIGGRLMDDGKRNKMLQEAKGLSSRFSSGKSGSFA